MYLEHQMKRSTIGILKKKEKIFEFGKIKLLNLANLSQSANYRTKGHQAPLLSN